MLMTYSLALILPLADQVNQDMSQMQSGPQHFFICLKKIKGDSRPSQPNSQGYQKDQVKGGDVHKEIS